MSKRMCPTRMSNATRGAETSPYVEIVFAWFCRKPVIDHRQIANAHAVEQSTVEVVLGMGWLFLASQR